MKSINLISALNKKCLKQYLQTKIYYLYFLVFYKLRINNLYFDSAVMQIEVKDLKSKEVFKLGFRYPNGIFKVLKDYCTYNSYDYRIEEVTKLDLSPQCQLDNYCLGECSNTTVFSSGPKHFDTFLVPASELQIELMNTVNND